jgi:hypothetical protein
MCEGDEADSPTAREAKPARRLAKKPIFSIKKM